MENKIATASEIDSCTPMPTAPEQLLAVLDGLGIEYSLHHHRAVFTVAESEEVDAEIPGTHCRNLFLRDDKKNNFLVVLQNATEVDIKKLPPIIGSKKLSFGSAERLWDYLGVRPGSVCPYSIINDKDKQVKICLDKSMMETDIVNYHPLLNTMTIGVKTKDLIRFIENCGHVAHIMDFSPASPEHRE
jgi:Ala-tRNA(Pro) deacylase